ncbi:hypothetical protein D3C81_1884260 [compost metagenome]
MLLAVKWFDVLPACLSARHVYTRVFVVVCQASVALGGTARVGRAGAGAVPGVDVRRLAQRP